MNQEQLQGNWQQLKGKIRQKWGKLTDDDLEASQGRAEILIGKIVERYGVNKEKAQHKLNKYLQRFNSTGKESTSFADELSDIAETVNEKGQAMIECCQEFVKEKPLTAIGIVAAVGAILGMLSSRRQS